LSGRRLDQEIAQVADRERRRWATICTTSWQHLTGTALVAEALRKNSRHDATLKTSDAEKLVRCLEEGLIHRNLARGLFSPELEAED